MNRFDTTEILERESPMAVHSLVRALIVADDPLVREGLQLRLGRFAAGEPGDGEAVTDAVSRIDANVVLWDLGPTGDREHELARQLGGQLESLGALGVPVIALAPAAGRRSAGAPAIGDLLGAGVAGVLARDVDGVALQHALDAVLHGLCVIDRGHAAALGGPQQEDPELGAPPARVAGDSLTAREHEVVQLMAEGLSNKQIADRLGISSHTAKFHVNAVLAKLDSSTRTEAVVRAVQRGVVML
jgi:two-component system, NarL family, nitrate/nitrite response regulator NarL